MKITALQKKITALEQQQKHPDVLDECMDVLDDSQLGALKEAVELNLAGFSLTEIEQMMEGRWCIYCDAEKALNARYNQLVKGKPDGKIYI